MEGAHEREYCVVVGPCCVEPLNHTHLAHGGNHGSLHDHALDWDTPSSHHRPSAEVPGSHYWVLQGSYYCNRYYYRPRDGF